MGILPILACSHTRSELGLPENWGRVNSWLKTSEKTVVNKIVIAVIPVKNLEIPVLKNYVSGAAENFWKTFPSKEMPTAAVTKINIDKLEQITREKKGENLSFVCGTEPRKAIGT
jgi:hypothetical protein